MVAKKIIRHRVTKRRPRFSGGFVILVLRGIWQVIKSLFKVPQEIKNVFYVKQIRKKVTKKTTAKQKKKKRGWWKKILLFLTIVFLLGSGGMALWVSSLTIPSISEIQRLNIAQATKIFDRNGELLYNIYGDEKRTIVEIDDISRHMINATIAVEDKDFYKHSGVKITSIIKAAWENATQKRTYTRGGSTITQQAIKNTILTKEKTYTRKIKEAILAYKLEKIWSKKQILELYLNESPFGGTIYGVEEAAQYYFGIPASELSVAQSAYLAAIPQAPTTYSPYGQNREKLDSRKNLVLSLMLDQGFITADEFQDARKEEVEFVFKSDKTGIKAPHFVMFIIEKLKEEYTDQELRSGGLRIHTTLDLELQEDLETIVQEQALKNEEDYNAENGAVIVMDSQSGHILAMVGSRDYFDEEIDGKFNIATAYRQPGSAFKPVVYLTALQQGYTPDTIVWDVPTQFSPRCEPEGELPDTEDVCYSPKNFDNKFNGPMTLKYALPESRNIPAVKFLHLVGINNALQTAKLMGITTLNRGANYYGLNLVLGGGEIQLLELATAYSVLSTGGFKAEPQSIIKITDVEGEVVLEPLINRARVVAEDEVLWMSEILSTNEYKINTFGNRENEPLYYHDRQVAVKTGTTDGYRDAWTIGYDPQIVVGAWVGNNNNTSMKPSKAAHYLWRASMDRALQDRPILNFKEPTEIDYTGLKPALRGYWQGNKIIKIDTKTNTLATEDTPDEFIKEVVIPEYHTVLHWLNKSNPLGPIPEDDGQRDDLYLNWENGVQTWVAENKDFISEDLRKLIESITGLTLSENKEEDGGESDPEDLEDPNN